MLNTQYKVLIMLGIFTNAAFLANGQSARLLTSYLPASMQALAYYINQLQYEPLSTATVEPPFTANATSTLLVQQATTITTTLPNQYVVSKSTTARPAYSWTPPSWWQSNKPTNTPAINMSSIVTTTRRTTTKVPTSSTLRPQSTMTSTWWKPPTWWQNPLSKPIDTRTTTTTTETAPTPAHAPGIFAPLRLKEYESKYKHLPEGYEIFCEFKASDIETLAVLPSQLIRDIRTETEHDHFTNDIESLDNFLQLYDDNYGRDAFSNVDSVLDRWSSTSTAGKKRVPPNKPYVEFLLVYDLLKRDAKAENLSKYEGYSDEFLLELHELSQASAPRQLHTLFSRMLKRRDIQRSDVVSRIQMLVKELGNPQSETAKALQLIPAMQFLP